MKWSKAPLILLVLVAVSIGVGVWRDKAAIKAPEQFNMIQSGTYLSKGRALPPFTLTSHQGTPFTQENFHDHWSFVFFGYTSCPEMCPRTLGIMQQLAQIVGSASHSQFILMSIDPEHDTPARLKDYFSQPAYQHLPFIWLTGDNTQIQQLTHKLGIYVQEGGIPTDKSHLEHSGTLLLVNPQGEFIALFNNPDNPKLLARDFQKVMQLYANKQQS